jgi:DNA polymerase-1
MFNNNFDLHAFTASLILNKTPEEITPEERKKYKSISLGYWYGMGVEGIVYRTGLQKRFVRTVTDKLDQKFQVLRSRVTDFQRICRNTLGQKNV